MYNLIILKSMKSPKVKKLGPNRVTSPENYTVTGRTEKSIRNASSHVYTVPNPASKTSIASSTVKKVPVNAPQKLEKNTTPLVITQTMKAPMVFQQYGFYYIGDILNGKFHGQGTIHSLADKYVIYNGEWRYGAREGFGHYKYPDGSQYDGEWHQNMKHGKGTYSYEGKSYSGEWKYNKRDGFGKLTLSHRVIIEGQWKDDQMISGSIIYPDQTRYDGNIHNFQRNGNGQYKYNKEERYEGEYVQDGKEGRGKYFYQNGDVYEGGFHQGKREGKNCQYLWKSEGLELRQGEFHNDIAIHGIIYDIHKHTVVHKL